MAASVITGLFLFFCLLQSASAERQIKEITAHHGDDVTLPCRAPYYVTTVEWIRSDLNKRVFLKRDGHLETAYQDPSYVNRVQLKNGELSLILKNVNSNDEGTYECRYVQAGGCWERGGQIKLIVILNAGEPPIQQITAHHGRDVTLSCRAPNNVIVTAVDWIRSDLNKRVFLKRDGHLETAYQDPSYVNRVQLKNSELSLILKNANSNDEGTYECRYEERGRWERGGQIKLVVIQDAGDPQVTAHHGDDVTLPCRAPNYAITAVEWVRSDLERHVYMKEDGHLNTADQDPFYVNRVQLKDDEMKNGDLSLILKNVNNNDEGTYVCYCKEIKGRRKRSDQMNLISIVQLDVTELQITAKPGDDVTLPCEAPNYDITAVEWTRSDLERHVYFQSDGHVKTDDQEPSYVNRVQLKDDEMKNGNLSLILKNVNNNDEGKYECRSKGIKGRSKRAVIGGKPICIVFLKVKEPPRQPIKEITAHPGDEVTLSCRAPYQVAITAVEWIRSDLNKRVYWKVDGNLETAYQDPSYVNRVQLKDGELSLILKNVNSNDEGTYECQYEESGRWERGGQIKLVVIQDAGEPPITAQHGDNVTLPCKAPNNVILTAVEWIRSDLEKHVYMKTDGHLNTADQDPSYVNRVQLKDDEMKNGDLSLILKNVNNNDEGTYECRSKMLNGGRRKRSVIDGEPISIVYLKVEGPTGGDSEGGKNTEGGHPGVILSVTLIAALVAGGLVGFVIYKKLKGRSENNSDLPVDDPGVVQPLQENENSL